MNRIDELKSLIENCKRTIESSEKEIEMLKAKKPTFERVEEGEEYYSIEKNITGKFVSYPLTEENISFDKNYFKNNNYFHTKERADEVADKINFLLKLERLHDTFCPDYKPDWNDGSLKWYVYFDYMDKKYISNWTAYSNEHAMVSFDSLESACKVCEILNKELENE